MNRWKNLTFLLIAGPALMLSGCGSDEPEPIAEIVRPVRTIRVGASTEGVIRTFSGIAQAAEESDLSFRVDGRIDLLPVKVGDRLKKDDLIARLDPADYQIMVQEALSALTQALAEARNAQANYERIRALYENRNASRNELDAARSQAESGQAAVRTAEQQLELAERQLGYTELRAPAACSVAMVAAEQNENIGAGQPVVHITCGAGIEVEAAVPEMMINDIRSGDDAVVRFDAFPDRRFAAGVTEVGVTSAATGTTFPVTVKLFETDPAIRPGMAAEVDITFTMADAGRILVPTPAVGEDDRGRFVYVVRDMKDGIGLARRVPVVIGDLTEAGLEITRGLENDDLLVTAGVNKLEDGRKVRLLDATSQNKGEAQ